MTARVLACLFCALLLCLLRTVDTPASARSLWEGL